MLLSLSHHPSVGFIIDHKCDHETVCQTGSTCLWWVWNEPESASCGCLLLLLLAPDFSPMLYNWHLFSILTPHGVGRLLFQKVKWGASCGGMISCTPAFRSGKLILTVSSSGSRRPRHFQVSGLCGPRLCSQWCHWSGCELFIHFWLVVRLGSDHTRPVWCRKMLLCFRSNF